MQEKLNIQEIICNLVKTNALSSIIRMHNLCENFVKILDTCGGNRHHRATHLSEVLQRSGNVLQLRPCTQTVAEPRSECQVRYYHGQCLQLRCCEQRARY